MRNAFGLQLAKPLPQRLRTLRNNMPIGKSDRLCNLRSQQTHQIRIPHGCERVVLHRAFIKWQFTHKQIAHENGATILGEGRAIDCLFRCKSLHQRFGNWADVAAWRRIKRRTILPEKPLRPGFAQPVEGSQGFRNSVFDRCCPAFQRNDFKWRSVRGRMLWNANAQRYRNARPRQQTCKISRPRKVVGNGTKKCGHHAPGSFRLALRA